VSDACDQRIGSSSPCWPESTPRVLQGAPFPHLTTSICSHACARVIHLEPQGRNALDAISPPGSTARHDGHPLNTVRQTAEALWCRPKSWMRIGSGSMLYLRGFARSARERTRANFRSGDRSQWSSIIYPLARRVHRRLAPARTAAKSARGCIRDRPLLPPSSRGTGRSSGARAESRRKSG